MDNFRICVILSLMEIKIKRLGKYIKCEVADELCRKKSCLSPHKFTHINKSIDGVHTTWQDNFYSCSVRNYRGCPDENKIS